MASQSIPPRKAKAPSHVSIARLLPLQRRQKLQNHASNLQHSHFDKHIPIMQLWIKIVSPLLAAAVVVLLLILFWYRRWRQHLLSRTGSLELTQSATNARSHSLHAGIVKLQLSYRSNAARKASLLFHHLHHGHNHEAIDGDPAAPFDWNEYPRLVVEAVENGWSRFIFAAGSGWPPDSPFPFWGACAGCGDMSQREAAEISWEVPVGSSDFLQSVRFNPRAERSSSTSSPLLAPGESFSVARMLLPLPGPPLGISSFPREAYFEITVLYLKPRHRVSKRTRADECKESDRTKLIMESLSSESQSAVPILNLEFKADLKEEGKGNQSQTLLCLGLAHGGRLLSKSLPGTYPGAIGFHSNGCVYLDGTKLGFESEKADWAEVNRVIGCGFDPSKKKVFFTVDSELKHVISCKSDAYKTPLFPVLASNTDAMLLVNLGQIRFKYEPANARRTPNPCFLRSSSVDDGAASVIDGEDSRDLFSMGRIDSQWFDAAKKSQGSSKKSDANHNDAGYTVDEADSDFFEISI